MEGQKWKGPKMEGTMKQSLTPESMNATREKLKKANHAFNQAYAGTSYTRQAIHTVYGGAHLFTAQLAQKMSGVALRSLEEYAPRPANLLQALGLSDSRADVSLWGTVYSRVVEKLKREAVEDFRIDFEDGYGSRPDSEEDGHAQSAALEVAKGMKEKSLPPFIGIRIKPLSEECAERSVRTLDLFLSALFEKTGDQLPENFVVTLPKITIVEQSRALNQFLTLIEKQNGLKPGSVKVELMVETPQSILDESGASPLRRFVEALEGRCVGAHFGTYDYTALCNITAAYQSMMSPVCDFAKQVMQVSLAGSPVLLSDGATNVMPVGSHRAPPGGALTREQKAENEAVIHRAWRLSYSNIRHSLANGYYQGWDLHPGQIPIRYAAVYSFFLESLEPAGQRLKAFVDKAAKATLSGDIFDDAATGQGLLNFFLRGISCGAITESEALATGLSIEDFRGRSFLKILERRKLV